MTDEGNNPPEQKPQTPPPNQPGAPPPPQPPRWFTDVPWSLIILLVFAFVILMGLLFDAQVLRRLQDPAYARGVITFLVSLAAIALAFMFSYQAFTADSNSENGFRRGREVLTGLMGVLGTIVGFYFGSTEKGGAGVLAVELARAGTNVIAHMTGGTPPYRGSIRFKPDTIKGIDNLQSSKGWMVIPLQGDAATNGTKATIEVQDAKDQKASGSIDLKDATETATPTVTEPPPTDQKNLQQPPPQQ